MKNAILSTLALCLIIGTAVAGKNAADTKDATVSGWVTDPMCTSGASMADGECVKKCAAKQDGKLVLVTDGDNKVWAVENSQALKGHEGHHVKVTGHPDEDKGTIKVVTVALLQDQKPPADKKVEMKHDTKKSDTK
jgi:hypothetical protein